MGPFHQGEGQGPDRANGEGVTRQFVRPTETEQKDFPENDFQSDNSGRHQHQSSADPGSEPGDKAGDFFNAFHNHFVRHP